MEKDANRVENLRIHRPPGKLGTPHPTRCEPVVLEWIDMTEETQSLVWKKCGSCSDGRVALLTSVQVCEICQGTGIDLSDARLDAGIQTPEVPIRVRKGLARQGIENLRQLVCRAVAGNLKQSTLLRRSSLEKARRYLKMMGLPAGPELPPDQGATDPPAYED